MIKIVSMRIKKGGVFIFLILLLLVSVSCDSGSSGSNASDAAETSFDAIIQNAVDRGLPGVALYVNTPNFTYNGAAGLAERPDVIYTSGHLFRIASNSKSFLGVVAAELHDENIIDLDRPVSDYVSAQVLADIENADTATVRQLLNHTSGIFDYLENDDFWSAVEADPTHTWATEEALEFAKNQDAEFETGGGWSYSNTNYLLAGLALDAVLGHDYAIEIRDRIFTPLGMSQSFCENHETVDGDIVHGYIDENEDGVLEDTYNVNQGYGLADGGIVATAQDLGIYISAMGEGTSLLSDSVRSIIFDNPVEDDEGSDYGLGISVRSTTHGNVVEHGGGLDGYSSDMFYYPDHDTTIVLFVNASDGSFEDQYDNLLRDVEAEVF